MFIVDLFLIGVGLSMDAFAASACKGLQQKRINGNIAFITAFFFGLFQALMHLIGWLLGSSFTQLIQPFDHWVAFGLLAAVGCKMLWDAFHPDTDDEADNAQFSFRELIMLSIATSIDALVIGVSFAMTGINIWIAIVVIGVTTFVLSLIGFVIGNKFGSKYEKAATILGGCALIILGIKIVLEHLVF